MACIFNKMTIQQLKKTQKLKPKKKKKLDVKLRKKRKQPNTNRSTCVVAEKKKIGAFRLCLLSGSHMGMIQISLDYVFFFSFSLSRWALFFI